MKKMKIVDVINRLLDDALCVVWLGLSDGKMRANTIKKLVLMLSTGRTEITEDELKKADEIKKFSEL